MAKMTLTIEVVEITRKGEQLGYKVYINDFVHAAKLPRKPGDLNRQAHPGMLRLYEHITNQSVQEPVDYYTGSLIESVQQSLIDWQIWKEQGYKRPG